LSTGVRAGEDHDGRSVRPQASDAALEHGGQPVRIGIRSDEVVAAGRDRDEVGTEFERHLHLLVENLPEQTAADRQVGIGEVLGLLTEHLGHPVGPTAIPAGALRLGVADSLRERVAESHVAGPGMMLSHSPTLHQFRAVRQPES
jgi:hypothetical protein